MAASSAEHWSAPYCATSRQLGQPILAGGHANIYAYTGRPYYSPGELSSTTSPATVTVAEARSATSDTASRTMGSGSCTNSIDG